MVFQSMAVTAYRGHILRVVRCTTAFIQDVMYLQLSTLLFTCLAGISVTVKDIGTYILIVVLRPFLLQFPMDLRILHPCRVETPQLDGKAVSFRQESQNLPDPPDMVVRL